MSLRKSAITLYAATVLALFSSPLTAADAYFYSEHGDWETRVEINEDEMLCASHTRNAADEVFEIALYPNGDVSLFMWFDNRDMDIQSQPGKAVIGGIRSWDLSQVTMAPYGGYFQFQSPLQGLEFIMDIQRGRWLNVTRSSDHPLSGEFSLTGSAASMKDLFECFRRIQGSGA
jgi:hypothetical protein